MRPQWQERRKKTKRMGAEVHNLPLQPSLHLSSNRQCCLRSQLWQATMHPFLSQGCISFAYTMIFYRNSILWSKISKSGLKPVSMKEAAFGCHQQRQAGRSTANNRCSRLKLRCRTYLHRHHDTFSNRQCCLQSQLRLPEIFPSSRTWLWMVKLIRASWEKCQVVTCLYEIVLVTN